MERETGKIVAGQNGGRGQVVRFLSGIGGRASAAAERLLRAGEQRDVTNGRRIWVEQGELWKQASAPIPVANEASLSKRVESAAFDFTATEIVRSRTTRPVAARTHAGTTAYAERRHAMPATEKIARFLRVNRSVLEPRGSDFQVLSAQRRSIGADYDLWKGPKSRVAFLMG